MKMTSKKTQAGVKLSTGVKAGGFALPNHSRSGLAVKTKIKAGEGIVYANHSRRLA